MAAGRYVSLAEVLRNPRLLGRFINDRIAAGYGEGDEGRFEGTLLSMARSYPPNSKTSRAEDGEGCSDIRTPPNTSEDT